MAGRSVGRLVQRLLIVVVVALYVVLGLVLVRSYSHEFLTTPAIADCRNGDAMALSVESTRKHGFIVKREFAECTFYWHEATTEGKKMKWRLLMWFVLPLIAYYALLYLVVVLLTSGGD